MSLRYQGTPLPYVSTVPLRPYGVASCMGDIYLSIYLSIYLNYVHIHSSIYIYICIYPYIYRYSYIYTYIYIYIYIYVHIYISYIYMYIYIYTYIYIYIYIYRERERAGWRPSCGIPPRWARALLCTYGIKVTLHPYPMSLRYTYVPRGTHRVERGVGEGLGPSCGTPPRWARPQRRPTFSRLPPRRLARCRSAPTPASRTPTGVLDRGVRHTLGVLDTATHACPTQRGALFTHAVSACSVRMRHTWTSAPVDQLVVVQPQLLHREESEPLSFLHRLPCSPPR